MRARFLSSSSSWKIFFQSSLMIDSLPYSMAMRQASLNGLSPRENRDVPPLDYALVRQLKTAHPDLPVVLNGGLVSLEQAQAELGNLDGVMLGRAAYQEPWRLMAVDPVFFGAEPAFISAKEAGLALIPYIERELTKGSRLHGITRHVLGLFRAVPGARAFRRHLATEGVKPGADASVLAEALALVGRQALDLALIDIGLPEVDGCELARLLRVAMHEQPGEPARLVALTGYSDLAVRESAGAAGFDAYVVKPIMPDALAALLSGQELADAM